MSRARAILLAVLLAVLATLVTVTFVFLVEPVESVRDVGFEGAAAVNHLLALETLLDEMGVPAESVRGLIRYHDGNTRTDDRNTTKRNKDLNATRATRSTTVRDGGRWGSSCARGATPQPVPFRWDSVVFRSWPKSDHPVPAASGGGPLRGPVAFRWDSVVFLSRSHRSSSLSNLAISASLCPFSTPQRYGNPHLAQPNLRFPCLAASKNHPSLPRKRQVRQAANRER